MKREGNLQRVVFWGLFGTLGLGMLSGCAKTPKTVHIEEDPPVMESSRHASLGSLWEPDNGRAFMFEDRRASRVGDIVIVRIIEQHSGSKSANTKADRDSSISAGAGGGLFGLNSLTQKFAQYFDLDATTSNAFEGKGSTSREDSLNGTIAAKVVEVFPNGDLRIRGKREVTVNSEKQTMIIRGIVRRIDLDTTNTVISTAVADAQIEYTGLGVVDEVQRPGWLVRLFNWLTPF
ncbi:MAG: flagellar basal body L-ring protein FlgH [Nitrospirales bacterium]|nr:flagellar basal body L-ring protein FlgH [Nitrospirales bacterium]